MKTSTPMRNSVMLGLAALFAAAPVGITIGKTGLGFAPHAAYASNGSDDSGGDSSGNSGSGNSGSGNSGSGNSGSDDSGRDDSGRRGDSSDDGVGHHTGGMTGGQVPGTGNGVTVVKFESSASGVEVITSDGWKQEIENGHFELKNPAGRTVEERPATQADIDRLLGLR